MHKTYSFAAGVLVLTVAVVGFAAKGLDETAFVSATHPAIQYADRAHTDRAQKIAQQLESGKLKLEAAKDGTGYLASLLKALGVNADSQMLVFSKTSFQASRINPRNPRAIYFSDDVQVGYVRGTNLLEIASLDPRQGVMFYSFDQQSSPPRLDRRDICLECHQSPGTLGVPGLMIASVFPDGDGMPAFRGSQPLTDHRTRFDDRWGGWYVTGTHGDMRHNGNALGHDPRHPEVLDFQNTQNQTTVAKRFDAAGYLLPSSDIVALMTMEHQTRMTNLIIRAGWEARIQDPSQQAQLDADVESLVRYMLFADEAPVRDTIKGVSTFTQTFTQRGPFDSKGRTLREFDLEKRMFRYPLSYMIYSDAFEGMPDTIRARVYQRLFEVLTAKEPDPRFAKLSAEDRSNIREIVRETKKGLPEYW
jgi:hypothetical protein